MSVGCAIQLHSGRGADCYSMHRAYNQAIVRKEAKEFDAAFQLYDEALAIRIAVYGQTSQVVGDTLYHMANARVLQGLRAGEKFESNTARCIRCTLQFRCCRFLFRAPDLLVWDARQMQASCTPELLPCF